MDHVGQGDRHAPGPSGRRAGEGDQVFGLAPHPGGEVIEPEEGTEFVRIAEAAFPAGQKAQLTVEEDLAAAGEVDEDTGDVATRPGRARLG
jgi:hypothetical protein